MLKEYVDQLVYSMWKVIARFFLEHSRARYVGSRLAAGPFLHHTWSVREHGQTGPLHQDAASALQHYSSTSHHSIHNRVAGRTHSWMHLPESTVYRQEDEPEQKAQGD